MSRTRAEENQVDWGGGKRGKSSVAMHE